MGILDPKPPTRAELSATILDKIKSDSVPKWKATTAYLAGDKVLSPAGDVVSAKANFTSGANYSAANWDLSPTYATPASVTAATAGFITASEATPPPARRVAPARATPITRFQAGHGWVKNGTGTVNLNNTTNPVLGTQYVSLTTNGAGTGLLLDKIGAAAMDLTTATFAVLVRISDVTKLSGFTLYAGTSAFANYELMQVAAIVDMNSNEWTWQHFSWADVVGSAGTLPRNAVTDLRFRVADNNTATPVTVDIAALDIIPRNATFPNGVLTFGFDDGYVSAITKAAPILDAKGWAATAYPIIGLIGTTGNIMTVDQLKALYLYHRWSIGGHAYDNAFHQTGLGMTNGTVAAAEADMLAQRRWLLAQGFGSPDFYAWPQGISNTALEAVAAKYWSTARGVNSTLHATIPPDRPLKRHAFPIDASVTAATVNARITKAYAAGAWLDLIIHDVVDSGATGIQVNVATLQAIVDQAATTGIPVRTTNEVMQAMS